jgi:peptidyl-tRNA hydrolase, PTH2 family
VKQVIVVNHSLKLPPGKLAAQVAHASVGAFLATDPEAQQRWLEEGMPKVVLKGEDEAHLAQLESLAEAKNIPCRLIRDAGRTVLPAGTTTCLGLGPAPDEEIDLLTGELKLLP